MKAIVFHRYGMPDVLQLEEVEQPTPKENEVLIKVKAASVNSWDWDLMRGTPFVNRLMFGLSKPKIKILGCDVAGQVERVGKKVKHFKPGDEVFGDLCQSGWGGFAEFVCAPEKALSLKSPGMSFAEAASLPQAGVMALQSVLDKKQLEPGMEVLINGGGGGVGTLALQVAKSYKSIVTVVDRADKFDMLKSLGADYTLDYRKKNFTKEGKCYDLIVDVISQYSIADYHRVLNKDGRFMMVGGTAPSIIQAMSLGPIISAIGSKKLGILVHDPNKYLGLLNELFEQGKFKPVVDKEYALDQAPEAFQHLGDGNVQGKVVITI